MSDAWADWWRKRGERELSLILWAAWNPIASGVPTDEFGDYAPQLGRLLREGADVHALERHLRDVRETELGLERPWPADSEAAALLLDWYEETCPARG